MQLSTKHGIAFLCVPKCASTSIEEAISPFCNINFSGPPPAIKHMTPERFHSSLIPLLKKLAPIPRIETFCTMREPIEWVNSWYRFRSRKQLKGHRNYTGDVTFNEFVLEFIKGGERKSFAKIGSQHKFLHRANGAIGVDYIMPMTRLDLVSNFLSQKFEKKIEIGHTNISPKKPVDIDHDIKQRLTEFLRKEILLYQAVEKHEIFTKDHHSQMRTNNH